VTLTRFDSLESARAFAGADYEVPVITETAAGLLSRYDDRAVHYELVAQADGAEDGGVDP
jgi:hypothetical protein